MSCHIICAHPDLNVAERLAQALRTLGGDALRVHVFRDAAGLLVGAMGLVESRENVAMVFSGLAFAGTEGDDLFQTIRGEPGLRGTRKILLDTAADREAVDVLLQFGLMQARLDPGFTPDQLRKLVRGQLTDYVVNIAPHLIDEVHDLLDLRFLAGSFESARKNLSLLSARLSEVHRSVIGEELLPSEKVEEAMISELDRMLDYPERQTFAPEEVMVHGGDEGGRIWVIVKGRVELYRVIEGEEVIFHSESAGRLVGLMSLSLQSPVFFSCRAATEVTAIVLTREQVREAVEKSPVLAHYLITVIMRTMARRNQRAAELLTEVQVLNGKLSRQRDELASALRELRAAQGQLVDTAKMAMLGNVAAGMAHELNNPVGAMLSSAEHLGSDLEDLLGMTSRLKVAQATIPLARTSPPLSTREERKLRDELGKELGIDANEAAQLVAAGVHSTKQFKKLAKHRKKGGRERLIEEMVKAGKIGAALRNISNCAGRVAGLVRSLKVYARDDLECTPGVRVNETLDDVLLILANKVKHLDLVKKYGELPDVCANPSQLQQIWTNLITNAVQEMGEQEGGRIELRTSVPKREWVRVEVEDNGPGIPEEAKGRLWDMRFTTRGGRVEFGLGLGLPIVRSLVHRHRGRIHVESEPGRTVFTVDLPECPKTAKEKEERRRIKLRGGEKIEDGRS